MGPPSSYGCNFLISRPLLSDSLFRLDSLLLTDALFRKDSLLLTDSLEDRKVKRMMRSGGFTDALAPRDEYGNVRAPWKPLTRRAVVASDVEIAANPRSRSARLRVAERTSHPVR